MADDLTLTQPDLVKRLLNNLPGGYTKSLVNTPNSKFTTPSDSKFLRITVIPFNTESGAASGGYKITSGLCVIDVFYPIGSNDTNQLSDTKLIKTLYENQTFGNTQCQEASILSIGESGSWYIMQVSTSFYMEGF